MVVVVVNPDRVGNLRWCSCGNCQGTTIFETYIHECGRARERTGTAQWIVDHPDFERMRKRQHHEKAEVAVSRPQYREARWERAVKAYTVNQESRFLIVFNVPAIKVESDLATLCAQFGSLSCNQIEDYPCEEFTEAFLVIFQTISSGRLAKRKLDNRSFFGSQLHVTYAPEQESVDDTRQKLQQRRQDVVRRLAALQRQRGELEKTAAAGDDRAVAKAGKSPAHWAAGAAAAVSSGPDVSSSPAPVVPEPAVAARPHEPASVPPPPPPMGFPPLLQPPPPPLPGPWAWGPAHVRPPPMQGSFGQPGWSSAQHFGVPPATHHPCPGSRLPPPPLATAVYGAPAHGTSTRYPSMDPDWVNPRPPCPPPQYRPYSVEDAARNLGPAQGPQLPSLHASLQHAGRSSAAPSTATSSAVKTSESVDVSMQSVRSRMTKAMGPDSSELAEQMGIKSKKRRRI